MIVLSSASALMLRQRWLARNRTSFCDQAPAALPRLLVDVSGIVRHDAQTGIQRVVRALWSELQRRNGQGFELVPVYASKSHGYCRADSDFLTARTLGRSPVRAAAGDSFLALDLAAHILPKYEEQLQSWRRNGVSVHVVVYDLLPFLHPEWFTAPAARHFRRWFSLLARQADQAICISNDVARQLGNLLRGSTSGGPTVSSFRLGSDIAASVPSTGISARVRDVLGTMEKRPSVLMVGTVEPRKGYDVALNAFESLWHRDEANAPCLVIAGKPGWKTEALQSRILHHPQQGRALHWLDRVSDEGLCRLYESCAGLLVASRAEGFGLPLLEAAKHGCPVLARDLRVFRDQGLPNVSYFTDDEPEALAKKIKELAAGTGGEVTFATLPTWSDSVGELLHLIGLAAPANASERFRAAAGQ